MEFLLIIFKLLYSYVSKSEANQFLFLSKDNVFSIIASGAVTYDLTK